MSAVIVAVNDQPGMHQFFDECVVTADVLSHPMDDLEKPTRRLTIAPAGTGDSQPVRAGQLKLMSSDWVHNMKRSNLEPAPSDLAAVDLLAAGDDHIFDSIYDVKVTGGVFKCPSGV